jgi:hypothetical protein
MIPRQSDILSQWIDDQWFTETSRERGNEVHRATSAIARGLWVSPLRTNQGYVDSFQAWYDAMVIEVYYVEGWKKNINGLWQRVGPLISQLGFQGTPDFIGLLRGDTYSSVTDWKTSVSKQKVWQLQVSGAYRTLAEENGYKPIGRCLSLRLDPDGGQAKLAEYGSLMDTAYFLRALDLWRFFHE